MADEILSCDGTDPIHIPDWDNVVGDRTLEDGGYIGDILNLTRSHIEEAKYKGELTEEDAGKAYSTAIIQSVSEAIKFEIQEGKSKLEMCFLQAQIDKLRNDMLNDDCLAQAECALKAAQTLKVQEETLLVTEKIKSEVKNNETDGMIDQQIAEMIAKVEIARTQAALDKANSIAEIDKVMGYNYTLDGDGNIVIGTSAGNGKLDAEVEKIFAEKDLVVEQDNEIPKESSRRDCTTASECKVNDQQIEKLICDCTNDTNMTDSKISLNAAQENKLACECCNDSKRTEGQIIKWECDCATSENLTGAQADLYTRQKEGFNDNANQKIYDTQMNAWAMVFADTDVDSVTPSVENGNIATSYDRIQRRLAVAEQVASQQY